MTDGAPLDRRELLGRGLRVGAVAIAAALSPGAPAGASAAGERDWTGLASSLTGRLVRPSTPGYNLDRLLYNSRFADLRPAAIAYCATREDVARCVDFVTRHRLAVAARSGGHSYGGYSSCAGLVVDVSRLDAVRVDTRANTALVGAGARLIDVYEALGRANRLLPAGSCPTVGIAGLALGGGVGVLGRRFGVTCDNLRAVELVDASGTARRVDAGRDADLLWACRGGGGGNFGVVTSLEFDVHPIPDLTLFSLQYAWPAAGAVLEGWQHWVAGAPDELWSDLHLLSQGTAGLLVEVSGVFCGSPSGLGPHLRSLSSAVGERPASSFVGSDDFLEAAKVEAGCARLSVAACHLATDRRLGVLGNEAYEAKSSYLDAPTSTRRAEQFVHALEVLSAEAPRLGGALAFDAYGGAINRVAAHETAFVHRDKLAGVQATFSWSAASAPSEVAAGRRWLRWLGDEVVDAAAGAYQNYIDPTLRDWPRAYYGENLARLTAVKRRYDPDDVFSFAQSVPLRA
ncbi:MAG: FAD-binding oxidoreductase [Acidobacteriota bacterium]|nr:FAD-binding oxidoreductase [Acidobacteriota bacterium]